MNLTFYKNQLLVITSDDGGLSLPTQTDILKLNVAHYMTNFVDLDGLFELIDENIPNSYHLIGFRQVLANFPEPTARKIIYYQQLLQYFIQHKFCGKCGSTTSILKHNVVNCKPCNQDIYPRISPAIMVRIIRDDEILLARGINFAPNIWALIAGYSDIGESLEETVHREVMEEVGIKITNVKYWGSQYWPMPNSLMVGFTATYQSGDICIDHKELETAGFFKKNNIPGFPTSKFSLASKMIQDWIDN